MLGQTQEPTEASEPNNMSYSQTLTALPCIIVGPDRASP
jgi:hypothetical protein